jgi:hypothetical protein
MAVMILFRYLAEFRYFDWLIIYCFTSRSRIFHLYGEVTIAGEGLQNLGLCTALRAFEQCGIFIVPHLLGFSSLIRRTAPFSRLLRHTWGCGGSILTRILTGIPVFWIQDSNTRERFPIFCRFLLLQQSFSICVQMGKVRSHISSSYLYAWLVLSLRILLSFNWSWFDKQHGMAVF